MIYFIDFDETIFHGDFDKPPHPNCLYVLNTLRKHNNKICIYSCRANPNCVDDCQSAVKEMILYLNKYNVPFDDIIKNKPYFNYVIDDRNVGIPLDHKGCVDWTEIKKILNI